MVLCLRVFPPVICLSFQIMTCFYIVQISLTIYDKFSVLSGFSYIYFQHLEEQVLKVVIFSFSPLVFPPSCWVMVMKEFFFLTFLISETKKSNFKLDLVIE
jgi:hypothetical protein